MDIVPADSRQPVIRILSKLAFKGRLDRIGFEPPYPHTGKGLLVQAATTPAAGQGPAIMAEGRDEDEWRKRITAKLFQGLHFILIANIRASLDSAALSAALTSPIWEDRILGHSRTAAISVTATWLEMANNPTFSLESARRVISIRLDSGVESPWERTGFTHRKLLKWAREQRGELIWAALTLVQAWIAKGRPAGEVSLGSSESWSEVVGGILETADIPGFLGNNARLYAEADLDSGAWKDLCNTWWEKYEQQDVTANNLLEVAIRNGLLSDIWSDRNGHGAKTAFGKALSKMRGRVLGDFHMRQDNTDKHSKAPLYRLERVEVAGVAGIAGIFRPKKKVLIQ